MYVHVNIYAHLTLPFSAILLPSSPSLLPSLLSMQLSRDKKTLEEKLQETQTALETEENKAKQEHRQRLKLESNIQDLDEKLHRETNVNYKWIHVLILLPSFLSHHSVAVTLRKRRGSFRLR